jgi:twitching motility protein PilU
MDIFYYLQLLVEQNGSDAFFSVGTRPHISVEGVYHAIGDYDLTPADTKEIAYSIMSDEQQRVFEGTMEMDLAINFKELGRFRVNIYRQRGDIAIVARFIKSDIPSIEKLNLPKILETLALEDRGLILVVGSAGSGKSTTLASMVDYRNQVRAGHILTIEDPIEFVHTHKRSIVDQREIAIDTASFFTALKNAMRAAPSVIMIGEIRDEETMHHAISYAESGHLCMSSLHANNANQAIERIMSFFPESAQQRLLQDLSQHLRAIIGQRLVMGLNGKRVPVVEIMLNTPYIAELIQRGSIAEIKVAMEQNIDRGMQTFDDSLYHLYKERKILREEAIRHADSHNNLALRIRLDEGESIPISKDLTINKDAQS